MPSAAFRDEAIQAPKAKKRRARRAVWIAYTGCMPGFRQETIQFLLRRTNLGEPCAVYQSVKRDINQSRGIIRRPTDQQQCNWTWGISEVTPLFQGQNRLKPGDSCWWGYRGTCPSEFVDFSGATRELSQPQLW